MKRIQVMLDPDQKQELDKIAGDEKISRSYLLRRMIREYLQDRKRNRLEAAVKELMGEYKTNPELTVRSWYLVPVR